MLAVFAFIMGAQSKPPTPGSASGGLTLKVEVVSAGMKEAVIRVYVQNVSDDIVRLDPGSFVDGAFLATNFYNEKGKPVVQLQRMSVFPLLTPDKPVVLGTGHFYGFSKLYRFTRPVNGMSVDANLFFEGVDSGSNVWQGRLRSLRQRIRAQNGPTNGRTTAKVTAATG